jgi:hypothetical protein
METAYSKVQMSDLLKIYRFFYTKSVCYKLKALHCGHVTTVHEHVRC